MNVHRAPTWVQVFLFGAVWNAAVEQSLWATALCLGVAVAIWLLRRPGG